MPFWTELELGSSHSSGSKSGVDLRIWVRAPRPRGSKGPCAEQFVHLGSGRACVQSVVLFPDANMSGCVQLSASRQRSSSGGAIEQYRRGAGQHSSAAEVGTTVDDDLTASPVNKSWGPLLS